MNTPELFESSHDSEVEKSSLNEPVSPESKRKYPNSLSSNPKWFEENESTTTNDPNKGIFSIPEINREEVMKEASVGIYLPFFSI